jgi:Flp pilus assembly pilin Flp
MFKRTKSFLRKCRRDESGQATTEYILILLVVVMIALKFKTVITGRMESMVENLGGQIESAMGN